MFESVPNTALLFELGISDSILESIHPEMFSEKAVLKCYTTLKKQHVLWSAFKNKVSGLALEL